MTLDYAPRLLALALAAFFLLHGMCGLLASGAARAAIRLAHSYRPGTAARMVLVLRFLPAGLAALLTIGVCVPSYFRYEPETLSEPVGFLCLACVGLGILTWLLSVARAIGALRTTAVYLSRAEAAASPYVAGIFVPRIVVTEEIRNALSPDELNVAVAHEQSHAAARDNLKRLLLLLAPGIAPFFRGYGRLEEAWARFAEWAADDAAVAGHPARAVSLAEVLVRLSRGPLAPEPAALTTSLLQDGAGLAARVERLLNGPDAQHGREFHPVMPIACALLVTAGAAIAARPRFLSIVHIVLEHFVH